MKVMQNCLKIYGESLCTAWLVLEEETEGCSLAVKIASECWILFAGRKLAR